MTTSSFDLLGVEAVDAVLNASRSLAAVAARSLSGTEDDVTMTQFRALIIVASNRSCSLNTLASALDVTAPTASRMCDRLTAKKLIDRRNDPTDRRQIQVALTEKGQALFDQVMERRRREIEKILRSIPDAEQQLIAESLGRFAAAADKQLQLAPNAMWDI